MAGIIPRAQQQSRMTPSSPVPAVSASGAGELYDAQGKAAEAFTRFGVAVADHYEKEKKNEDRIKEEMAANEMQNQFKLAKGKAEQDSMADGSDYKYNFQKEVGQRLPNVYSGLNQDSPESKKRLTEFGKKLLSDFNTSIELESAGKLEKSNYDNMEKLAADAGNRVRENPNEKMISAELQTYGTMLDEINMSDTNKKKAREAFSNTLATQYIEGLEDRGSYGKALNALKANQEDPNLNTELSPQEARSLGFIDGKEASALESKGEQYKVPVMTKGSKVTLTPELSAIMNGMSPKDKANWIDSLKGKALAESAMKLSELNAQVNGFESVAMSGGTYTTSQVAELKNQINSNPQLTVEARKRMNDSINTADAVNSQVKQLANVPRAKWGEVLAGFDEKVSLAQGEAAKYDPKMADVSKDFAVQANRMKAKDKLQTIAVQVAKLQDEKPAEYVIQTDKQVAMLYQASKSGNPADVQAYARATLDKQSYLGISPDNQRFIPEAQQAADVLKNLPSGYDASQFIDQVQGQYGPLFPRAMNEIIAKDKTLEKYRTAVFAPPWVRANLADVIKNEAPINEAFKASPGYDSNNTAIKNSTSILMEDFQKSFTGGSSNSARQDVVNGIREAVELQVRREAVKPGVDINAVTKQAYRNTVEAQFYFESGGQSQVVVPRQMGGMRVEEGIVSSFLRAHSSPKGLAEMNLAVPSGYKSADNFNEAVSREGRWVTNESMDGMQLKLRNPENGMFMPVLTKDGKPVEVKYQQINLNPSEATKQQNRWLGRMFSGINEGASWLEQNVAVPSN